MKTRKGMEEEIVGEGISFAKIRSRKEAGNSQIM